MAEFNQTQLDISASQVNTYNNDNIINNDIVVVPWYIDRTPEPSEGLMLINQQLDIFFNILHQAENRERVRPTIPFTRDITVICDPLQISEEQQNCCICMETRENEEICMINCGHSFCGECIKNTFDKNRDHLGCPLCRETVFAITTQKLEIKEMIDALI